MAQTNLPPPPKFDPKVDGWIFRLWQYITLAGSILVSKLYFSATQRVAGRNSAGAGEGEEVTATQILDWVGSTRGSVLYKGAAAWAELTPGTSGYALKSNGAGADPSYAQLDHGTALTGLSDDDHPQYAGIAQSETISGVWAFSTHPTGLDHTQISNIGSNSHATIDSHIADSTIHFTEGSIDHGSIAGLSDDDHPQYAQIAATETISAVWTFSADVDIDNNVTLDYSGVADTGLQITAAAPSGTTVLHLKDGNNAIASGSYWILCELANGTDRFYVRGDGLMYVAGGANITGTLALTGSMTVTGTVDGRDVAADGAVIDALAATYQPLDSDLTAIAALANTDGNFIVGNGTAWVAESGSTARTSLGLGSIATQASSSVSITGGTITGITDLTVADGGTGASTADNARINLGTPAVAAQSAASDGQNSLFEYDSRAVNDVASDFTTKGLYLDFKSAATGGAPAGSTYSGVMAFAPWGDDSGGGVHRLAFAGDGYLYHQYGTRAGGFGSWNKVWTADSDGSGSGLDADLLDGQSGSYYLDSANFTGTNWTDLTDAGATTLHKHDHGGQDGLTDDDHTQYSIISSSAAAPATTPSRVGALHIDTTADEAYIATATASSADWDQIWTAGNDGSGSGLDADLVRGTTPGTTGLALLDDSTAAAAIATLGLDADLATFSLPASTTISAFGATLVDDASASAARTTLGLVIGTDVQAYDADLAAIAALANTDSNFIVGNGTTWVAESGSTARTSLGLGTIATQNSNSVSITGGSVTGITDITVADGGTGRSTGTTAYALIATGTTATGAQQTLASGATTEILVGGGTTALPVWTTATGSGAPVRATSPTLVTPALGTPSSGTLTNCTGLPVAGGGSGRATATAYAVICGGTTATAAHQSIASVGSSGQVLTSNGASALPTFQDVGVTHPHTWDDTNLTVATGYELIVSNSLTFTGTGVLTVSGTGRVHVV